MARRSKAICQFLDGDIHELPRTCLRCFPRYSPDAHYDSYNVMGFLIKVYSKDKTYLEAVFNNGVVSVAPVKGLFLPITDHRYRKLSRQSAT